MMDSQETHDNVDDEKVIFSQDNPKPMDVNEGDDIQFVKVKHDDILQSKQKEVDTTFVTAKTLLRMELDQNCFLKFHAKEEEKLDLKSFPEVPVVVTKFTGLVVRLGIIIYDKTMAVNSNDVDAHPIMTHLNMNEKKEMVHHVLQEEERRKRKTDDEFKVEVDCIQETLTNYFKCRNLLLLDVSSKDLTSHFENLSKLIHATSSQTYFLHIVVFASAYVGHRLLLHNDTQLFDLDGALETYFGVRRFMPCKTLIHVMWGNSRGISCPSSITPENIHHKLQIVRIHPVPLGKRISCIFQIISNFQRFCMFASAEGWNEAAISTVHSFYPGQEVTQSVSEMNPYPCVVFSGNGDAIDYERGQEGKYVGIGQHWNLASRDQSFEECSEQLEYLCENLFHLNGIIKLPTIKGGTALDLDNALMELARHVSRHLEEDECNMNGNADDETDDGRTETAFNLNTIVLLITTDSDSVTDAGFSFRANPSEEQDVTFEYQTIYESVRQNCPSIGRLVILCNFGHGSTQLRKEVVGRSPRDELIIHSTCSRVAYTYLCEPGQSLGIFESDKTRFACGFVPIFINFLGEDMGTFMGNVVTCELYNLHRVIARIMKKDITQVHVLHRLDIEIHRDTKVSEYLFRRNYNHSSLECILPPTFLDILTTFPLSKSKGDFYSPFTTVRSMVPNKPKKKTNFRKKSILTLENIECYWETRIMEEMQRIWTPSCQAPLDKSQLMKNLMLLQSGNPPDKIVAGGSPHRVTQFTLNSLADKTWIEDAAIDNYLFILTENSKCNIHVFSCGITSLILLGDTQNTVSPEARMFERDLLLFPLNINQHWLLVVVNMQQKKVTCFNSNADPGIDRHACSLIINFLKSNEQGEGKTEWIMEFPINLPQQLNSNDCGAFLVAFAQYVIEDINIDFDQRHMLYFRHKVMCTILNEIKCKV